ncbi:hypothetical protein CHS0354_039548 [Potamilus streckersoni]|uniref:Uncharacterized protein n=1 Tax=Potamilus streckersoni TaxID=2493646 RepID=A0AAE0TL12_9BIVA|nr:hypothetical protein CHS0354_039548 [Potamilus streckersoni]
MINQLRASANGLRTTCDDSESVTEMKRQAKDWIEAIERSGLPGKNKTWQVMMLKDSANGNGREAAVQVRTRESGWQKKQLKRQTPD